MTLNPSIKSQHNHIGNDRLHATGPEGVIINLLENKNKNKSFFLKYTALSPAELATGEDGR